MVLPQRLVPFEPELYDMMHKSIEMGRAFIKEYQQNQCHFSCCGRNHAYHFALSRTQILLGGVSISNQFSDFSKSHD
jgi:hypothetical protein